VVVGGMVFLSRSRRRVLVVAVFRWYTKFLFATGTVIVFDQPFNQTKSMNHMITSRIVGSENLIPFLEVVGTNGTNGLMRLLYGRWW